MFAQLLKRYVVLHAAKLLHTTTTAVGTTVQKTVLGVGLILLGLSSAFFGLLALLGALFLYLADLQHVGALLIIGVIIMLVAGATITIGSSKLLKSKH